jgi:type VII secretion-associated serine protease mycosin
VLYTRASSTVQTVLAFHVVLVLLAVLAMTVAVPAPVQADDIGATVRAKQWSLAPLGVAEAWRRTRGENVVVAVLDTGVDAGHPDLSGAVIGDIDLTGAREDPPRRGHHGTAMASIIAGRGHGDGHAWGMSGIAPAATILSVKVTLDNDDPQRHQGRAWGKDALAKGIRYAVDHGAKVISISLGGGDGSWEGAVTEKKAVRYALERGSVLVASSGNDGAGPNCRNFPAAYPGVIAVGAVDKEMRVAPFSNRQEYLSLVAPGVQIVSATAGGSYVIGDGTSSAAAIVAGVVALIRSEFPRLTPAQVRRAVERGTTHIPAGGHSAAYGHGVVNAAHALEQAAKAQRRPLRAAAPRPASPGPTSPVRSGRAPVHDTGVSPRIICSGLILLVLAMTGRSLLRRRRHACKFPVYRQFLH